MQFVATIILLTMGLTFPVAPRVVAGQEPTSAQAIGLANAWNARERSGLGDMHWRNVVFWGNVFRQPRNADELGSMPSQAEAFDLYLLLDPENNPGTWPIAGPGEPEGANVNCPPNAFTFGVDLANFVSEAGRLGNMELWYAFDAPAKTSEEWWELAKLQRGVIDPNTGDQNATAIETAHAGQFLTWNVRMPFAKTYGGFFPTPIELLSNCGSDETNGLSIPSYAIKFTAFRSDVAIPPNHGSVSTDSEGRPVITYSGSCPSWTENFSGNDVQGISNGVSYYIVFFADGFDILPNADWVQGPYTGEGKLWRYDAGVFSLGVWAYANEFRGMPSQRVPDDYEIDKIAFSFQEFRTRSYHLAPNLGVSSGGFINTAYPRAGAKADVSIPAGTLLTFTPTTQTTHDYQPGFVFTGCFAKATNLFSPVALEVLSGTKVIARLTLSADEPQALKYLTTGVTPAPLSVRLASEARFTEPGEIIFEANEILDYKPDHWDAYLMLRLSSTLGGGAEVESPFVDGSGRDQGEAAKIYTNYAKFGCVVNTFTSGVRDIENAVNPNPVYDALRRLCRDMMRSVRHWELLSYGTNASGQPVIRLKRYAYGAKNQKADILNGIAPSYNTVGSIVEGVEYIVRSHTGGTIIYNEAQMVHGTRFHGIKGKTTYDATGDALCLEYEGIRAVAPPNGWSNEWLFSEEFHFYHPSDSSLWKIDSYADWYMFGNRCATYAASMSPDLARVADIPSYPSNDPNLKNLHLSPEIPSGYNYALSLNSIPPDGFCKSCPVYKKPYELASCTVEFSPTGDDIGVLVFREPFQRDASAPSSIDPNPLNWSQPEIDALRAEPYRTTDNGMREYFLWRAKGVNGSWKIADSAAFSSIQLQPDNPFGAIIPRLFATHLIEKPFEDGNSTYDSRDTRITIDPLLKLTVKLKCGCEGAIDSFATTKNICGGGSKPYDFTWEDLKLKAFSGRDVGAGWGPTVNTDLDALTFNQIAACIDELNMFRLEGVMTFETRTLHYYSLNDVGPQFGTYVCPPNAGAAAYWEGTPPGPSFVSDSGWSPASGFTADSAAALLMCGPGGAALGIESIKNDVEFRYVPTPGFEDAIPDDVRGLVDDGNIGVVGTITKSSNVPVKRSTDDPALTACSPATGKGPNTWTDGTTGWTFDGVANDGSPSCTMLSQGKQTAGDPPGGSFSVCSYPDASSGLGYSVASGGSSASITFVKLSDDGSAIIIVPIAGVDLT